MLAASACWGGEPIDAAEVSTAGEEPVVLRVGYAGGLVSDPLAVQPLDGVSALVADALTDGLTKLGPDGTVQGALARSWTTDDGVTWRFEIEGEWPDGEPIDSNDVLVSFQRVLASASTNLHGARLASVLAEKGVARDGDDAVVFVTREPNRELPAILAAVPYGVLRAEEVLDREPGIDLVGERLSTSGPFAVGVAANDSPLLTLRRVHYDDDAPVGSGPTTPSTLEFVRYSSTAMVVDALEQGELDVAQLDGSMEAPAGTTLVEVEGAVVYAAVGAQRALVDPAVRGAVVRAIAGDAPQGADQLVPGGIISCESCTIGAIVSDGDDSVGADDAEPSADGAAGASIRLVVGPGARLGAAGTEVAGRLAAVGVEVERVDVGADDLGPALDGTADVVVFVTPGVVSSPDVTLSALLRSGGAENLSGASATTFDRAIESVRAIDDDTARRDGWASLLRLVAEEAPVVPLRPVVGRWAVGERVRGAVSMAGVPFDVRVITVTP